MNRREKRKKEKWGLPLHNKDDTKEIKTLSVVIPVRNRPQLIKPCLEYLEEAARELKAQHPVEIIVVDDASTDETQEVIQEVARRSSCPIQLLTQSIRSGPTKARNLAMEKAAGDLIFFVDSDVLVERQFFTAHLAAHQKKGPYIYGMGKIISVPSLKKALEGPPGTIWDLSGASLDTANSSVRKEHLEAVGFFDHQFMGMGWMDIDLGRRLKAYGLKRTPVPEAISYHIQPPIKTEEQLQARLQKERERGRSAVYFQQKYPGLNARLATQDTILHHLLNWLFCWGGLIHGENVLSLAAWARKKGFTPLEKMWLAGVINRDFLESFRESRRRSKKRE